MTTTKAGDWFAARRKGVRLPQHMLPDDEPQILTCEICDTEPCSGDDWSDTAQMVVCQFCLETLAEQQS